MVSEATFSIPRLFLPSLLLLMCMFSGCQRGDQATVSFAFAGDSAELAAYSNLIEAFEQAHPEVRIQIRHAPSRQDFEQKLITMFDGGSPPDVLLLNYRRVARFAADGDLVPIEFETVADDPDAFYPIALEAFTQHGRLWCMPQNISSLVVYINRDMFDAAGVSYPMAGWSWVDFVATAKQLDQGIDGDYAAGVQPNLYRLAPLIWQAGGEFEVDSADLLPLTPENVAGLTFLTELQTVHKVVPNQLETESQAVEDRFIAGDVGMLFESRRLTPILRQTAKFEWDVAPLPQGEQVAGVLHSDGYCLGREPSEETLAFIRFAVSETGQKILAKTGRTVPSRIKIANSEAFLMADVNPANGQIWLDEVDNLRTVPWHPRWVEMEKIVSAEIEQAYFGRISPEEALARINQKAETILSP